MADKVRWDVLAFKEKKGGGFFNVRCGSATPGKQEGSWNLWLDAIPAPVEGQYRLSVVPPRERPRGAEQASNAGQGPVDLGDDIPFNPEFR
jgi:hypothetical protein